MKHGCRVYRRGLSVSVLTKQRCAYPVVGPSFSCTCRAFPDYGVAPAGADAVAKGEKSTVDHLGQGHVGMRAEGHNFRI